MICIKASLVLYFERNSRLNFAKIALGCAKEVLRSRVLPNSKVYRSRKIPGTKSWILSDIAGVYILEMSNGILIKCVRSTYLERYGVKHSIKIVFNISNMHTGQKSSF